MDSSGIYWCESGTSWTANNGAIRAVSGEPVNDPAALANSSPITSAGSLANPQGIAIDSGYVYWIQSSYGTVFTSSVNRVPKSGGLATMLATNVGELHGIAVDSAYVFFSVWNDRVYREPKTGGVITGIGGGASSDSIALDSYYVYWTYYWGGGAVYKAPKTGGTGVTISGGAQNSWDVVADQSGVYWTGSPFGTATITAFYNLPPTISAAGQPASQTASAGNAIVFSVSASSASPLIYQWKYNGQNIPGATNATLTLYSVTAANSGSYSVNVSNPYGSATNSTASLAVLDDGANGNTPAQIPTPATPIQPADVDSLIVITHGYEPAGANADVSWVNTMASDIQQRVPANWIVYPYIWKDMAGGLPPSALAIAQIQGVGFGEVIAQQHWKTVHLIAHSAGAGFVESVAKEIKEISPSTAVYCTFLDPYLGAFLEWQDVYGDVANWSDCYYTQDYTGGFTSGKLPHAYNVDVDWVDPNNYLLPFGSTFVAFSTHGYSLDFYTKTVVNTDPTWCAAGYGFGLSIEDGGAAGETSHPVGNDNNPTVLCGPPGAIPTPPFPVVLTSIVVGNVEYAVSDAASAIVNNAGFVLNSIWSSLPLVQSGGVRPLCGPIPQGSGGGTNTPAWLAMSVGITNAVNFVQFDAAFTDTNSAQGLLTVYWNTNQIGMVDERVAQTNLQSYRFLLPGEVTNGLYTLSFRLDSYNNSSSIAVTNVATGFNGPMQPTLLGLSFAGNTPVLQLTGTTNLSYLVQTSTNLVDWTPMAFLVNSNGTVSFPDTAATNSPARFYRALVP